MVHWSRPLHNPIFAARLYALLWCTVQSCRGVGSTIHTAIACSSLCCHVLICWFPGMLLRSNTHTHTPTLPDDFHATIAELGFVAPPSRSSVSGSDAALQTAVVQAVFRRMHGTGDEDSLRSTGTDSASLAPLSYHQFVRWAAPLDFRLYVTGRTHMQTCAHCYACITLAHTAVKVCSVATGGAVPHCLPACLCALCWRGADKKHETLSKQHCADRAQSAAVERTLHERLSAWTGTETGARDCTHYFIANP